MTLRNTVITGPVKAREKLELRVERVVFAGVGLLVKYMAGVFAKFGTRSFRALTCNE